MQGRPSVAGVGPELEWLALGLGIKPALRLSVAPHAAARAVEQLRRRGLAVERWDPEPTGQTGPLGRTTGDGVERRLGALLYVSADASRARQLREAEARVPPTAAEPAKAPSARALEAHRALGRLLGYPRCCVEAYLARVSRGVTLRAGGGRASERFVAAEDAARRSARRLGRLNFVAPHVQALVPFDPCRFDCAPAARYASALYAALRARQPGRAHGLARALVSPARLGADGRACRQPGLGGAEVYLEFDAF